MVRGVGRRHSVEKEKKYTVEIYNCGGHSILPYQLNQE
jgi:hypothetical protein